MRSRWLGSMFAWILNTKPVNGGFGRLDDARAAVARLRRRRPLGQRLQDLLHAEVVDAGAEEHRRLPAREELGEVERRARAAQELDVVAQRARISPGNSSSRRGLARPSIELALVAAALLARREAHEPVVAQVEHAAERLAHADRPRDRRAVDRQHRLDLLEQRQRLAHLAVHLVDERDDRRGAQAAHLEQLDRLLFDALGGVDHHHRRVDGGEHAVGVLGEVLVARRVEQVDRVAGVLELHHGARHRDAALLLDLHPVRRRVARALARLHGAGHLDRAAVQQQLLGQRRLARVRVRDDRERAPARDVAHEIGGKAVAFTMERAAKQKPPAGTRRAAKGVAVNYTAPRVITAIRLAAASGSQFPPDRRSLSLTRAALAGPMRIMIFWPAERCLEVGVGELVEHLRLHEPRRRDVGRREHVVDRRRPAGR